MEKFYVTKKKYSWIVKHHDHEFDLCEEQDDAVNSAKARASAVRASGGEAEVYLANVLGTWDKVDL